MPLRAETSSLVSLHTALKSSEFWGLVQSPHPCCKWKVQCRVSEATASVCAILFQTLMFDFQAKGMTFRYTCSRIIPYIIAIRNLLMPTTELEMRHTPLPSDHSTADTLCRRCGIKFLVLQLVQYQRRCGSWFQDCSDVSNNVCFITASAIVTLQIKFCASTRLNAYSFMKISRTL